MTGSGLVERSLLRCFHSRHRTASLHFGFDQAHLPPRRCSRQCPHIHALHAGFARYYARAFAQGGAGGHHVIEQGDMRGQLAAGFDCEGVAQVASTCARIKAALGLGAADPVQCVGMQRQTQRPRSGSPVQSLVVARARAGGFHAGARTARQPVAATCNGWRHPPSGEPAMDLPPVCWNLRRPATPAIGAVTGRRPGRCKGRLAAQAHWPVSAAWTKGSAQHSGSTRGCVEGRRGGRSGAG